jgi:hypothetical protein
MNPAGVSTSPLAGGGRDWQRRPCRSTRRILATRQASEIHKNQWRPGKMELI